MAMMMVYSVQHFQKVADGEYQFPYFGVLLYAPMNGLNARLHEYVQSHWDLLNGLTGDSCLLMAVEDVGQGPGLDEYKPEDIYRIARQLGADVSGIPCIVLFTEPKARKETVVLRLNDFLGGSTPVTDDELTDFFQSLASIIDACSPRSAGDRLSCLSRGLDDAWPADSRWHDRAGQAAGWVVSSVTTAATVFQAFNTIMTVIKAVRG